MYIGNKYSKMLSYIRLKNYFKKSFYLFLCGNALSQNAKICRILYPDFSADKDRESNKRLIEEEGTVTEVGGPAVTVPLKAGEWKEIPSWFQAALRAEKIFYLWSLSCRPVVKGGRIFYQ